MTRASSTTTRSWIALTCLAVVTLLTVALLLGHGTVSLGAGEVLLALMGEGDPVHRHIVADLRLPRLLTALIAGAALGVGGVLMQSLFRNPMADAWSLGLTAGGQLGVALLVTAAAFAGPAALGFLTSFQGVSLTLGAALGVAAAASAMVLLARRVDTVTLLVVGLMLWFTAQGLVSVIMHFANRIGGRVYAGWNDGTFAATTGSDLPLLAGLVALGLLVAVAVAKGLTALLLGETYAASLGTRVPLLRRLTLLSVVLLVAPVTAFCGPITFVGLIVPHFARALAGSARVLSLIPVAALSGGLLALLADAIVNAPWEQHFLHLNAVLAIIGAPVVIALLVGSRPLRGVA